MGSALNFGSSVNHDVRKQGKARTREEVVFHAAVLTDLTASEVSGLFARMRAKRSAGFWFKIDEDTANKAGNDQSGKPEEDPQKVSQR